MHGSIFPSGCMSQKPFTLQPTGAVVVDHFSSRRDSGVGIVMPLLASPYMLTGNCKISILTCVKIEMNLLKQNRLDTSLLHR